MSSPPHVLVVGGGSTGTAIARDAAMRGFGVTLVERGTLTAGTSGRMHGLLHSGGRYAVADPESARECIAENRVLRSIADHCIEDTGGLFVQRPEDDAAYVERKRKGLAACDIPVTELTGREARRCEPELAADITRALAVPDAAIDPFRLCVATAASAEVHGAQVETHTRVTDLLVEDGRVVGARVDRGEAGTDAIRADHVVNATGAWAGQIAAMAGVDVPVTPSKGAMTVTNVRPVDTVINRCRPKGDADILVPHETTAILGTTDERVADPDDYLKERWERDLLVEALSDLVPALRTARTIRSFWGVRPLYDPDDAAESRTTSGDAGDADDPSEVSRGFRVLDHARDDCPGLTTIVGGKLTTARLMAEAVVDHLADRYGIDAVCRTADRPLPGSEHPADLDRAMERFELRSPVARRSAERLGSRTDAVLDTEGPNPVLCSCEAVTRAEVCDAVAQSADLDAVRIRTRAGMGTCQGGFCGHRLATCLARPTDQERAREALTAFRAERWAGQRHELRGEQLEQAAITYALHAATMNHDGDPIEKGANDFAAFDTGPPGPAGSDRTEEGEDGD